MATDFDAHTNLAISLVATAPSPATTGTSLVVTASDGALFPAADGAGGNEFNIIVWPADETPTRSNAEICRVTNRTTDTLTIARDQEEAWGARTIIVGDQVALVQTSLNATDWETAINALETSINAITDVDTTTDAPATDDVLAWNGTKWTPATLTTTGTATYNEVAATGATETINWAQDPDSIVHDCTMDQNCTFSFGTPSGDNEVNVMTLILRGAFTPTLPASIDWAGGSAPTYTTPSVYEFMTVDNGTTVLGFQSGAAIT